MIFILKSKVLFWEFRMPFCRSSFIFARQDLLFMLIEIFLLKGKSFYFLKFRYAYFCGPRYLLVEISFISQHRLLWIFPCWEIYFEWKADAINLCECYNAKFPLKKDRINTNLKLYFCNHRKTVIWLHTSWFILVMFALGINIKFILCLAKNWLNIH